MDIHKPKAARSLREFMIEIGTITIGILIALGLEALVQERHNHDLADHARADLRRELDGNRRALLADITQERAAAPGLDRLIDYYRTRLSGKSAKLPPDLKLDVSFQPMNDAAWQSTVGAQALVHMPYDQAQVLARAYAGTRIFSDFQADAVRHWFELSALPDDSTTLSDDDLKWTLRILTLNREYQASLRSSGAGLLKLYDNALASLK